MTESEKQVLRELEQVREMVSLQVDNLAGTPAGRPWVRLRQGLELSMTEFQVETETLHVGEGS